MKEKAKSILVEVVNDAIVQMAYSTRTSFLDLISKQARPGAAVSAFLLKQKFAH